MKPAYDEISPTALLGGSSRGGYQINSNDDGILHLVCWGIWDPDVGHSFKENLSDVMQELKETSEPWFFCANFEDFPPQGNAVAKVQGELMKEAKACGVQAAAGVVTSAMTRLQIQRIAEENGMHGFHLFSQEKDAHSWLLEQQRR